MKNEILNIGEMLCQIEGLYWQNAKNSRIKGNLFWLLYALNDGKFHTQKQICDDWLFPRSTINTLVKECEPLGLIELEAIEGKRELQLRLSKAGRRFAKPILAPIYAAENEANAAFAAKFGCDFTQTLKFFASSFECALRAANSTKNGSRQENKRKSGANLSVNSSEISNTNLSANLGEISNTNSTKIHKKGNK